jgi:hypothetical protein
MSKSPNGTARTCTFLGASEHAYHVAHFHIKEVGSLHSVSSEYIVELCLQSQLPCSTSSTQDCSHEKASKTLDVPVYAAKFPPKIKLLCDDVKLSISLLFYCCAHCAAPPSSSSSSSQPPPARGSPELAPNYRGQQDSLILGKDLTSSISASESYSTSSTSVASTTGGGPGRIF